MTKLAPAPKSEAKSAPRPLSNSEIAAVAGGPAIVGKGTGGT